MPEELMIQWTSLFSKGAVDAANRPIRTVTVPIKGAAQLDDTLSTVLSTMLHHGIDLVPVLDGEKVAGVVLMMKYEPNLLLAWDSGTPVHIVDELRKRGYRVEVVKTSSLADISAALIRIGAKLPVARTVLSPIQRIS